MFVICHSCLKKMKINDVFLKQGKWVYCSNECYNFI